jgi:FAD/FMN-containing dehydrogenase
MTETTQRIPNPRMARPSAEPAASGPLTRGDPGYDDAVAAWNLLVEHRPAAAFRAASTRDVAKAVRYARHRGLGVAVTLTGHGIPGVGPDGVLVNTAAMRSVRIDAERRTATVGAGARWRDVHAASAEYGLVGVAGSSMQVGVVGYTQGGGFGWLSRRLGFASSWVRAAELVTANGEIIQVDEDCHPDLLWAVAGGGGNVGVVTSLTFDLHPVGTVYGGNLYFPLDRARQALDFYAAWAPELPVAFMSALTFRSFPAALTVPEPLRGRSMVALRACYSGPDLESGQRAVAAARRTLGAPAVDTFAVLPGAALDGISLDPTEPVGAVQHAETLIDLGPEVVDALADAAGPDSGSPFVMLELRQLGGALRDAPRGPHPMARTSGSHTVNAIGLAAPPDDAERVRQHHRRLYDRLGPHLTGTTYLNFLDGAGPDPVARVRAAYTAQDYARLVDLKTRYDSADTFRWGRRVPPRAAAAHDTNGEPS